MGRGWVLLKYKSDHPIPHWELASNVLPQALTPESKLKASLSNLSLTRPPTVLEAHPDRPLQGSELIQPTGTVALYVHCLSQDTLLSCLLASTGLVRLSSKVSILKGLSGLPRLSKGHPLLYFQSSLFLNPKLSCVVIVWRSGTMFLLTCFHVLSTGSGIQQVLSKC